MELINTFCRRVTCLLDVKAGGICTYLLRSSKESLSFFIKTLKAVVCDNQCTSCIESIAVSVSDLLLAVPSGQVSNSQHTTVRPLPSGNKDELI
jgi:hypothetical protein